MSRHDLSDRATPATNQRAPQASQSAQTLQFHETDEFPPGLKNAKNGPKVGQNSQFGESGQIEPHSAQSSTGKEVGRELTPEEQAYFAAEYARLSDSAPGRANRKLAGEERAEQPKVPFQQVVIPAAWQILARRKIGRPRVIDEDLREKIVTLLGAGASMTQTAAHLGVGRTTIAAALERDQEFAQEVQEARQRASLFPLNCLLREASQNWRAAAWLLTYLDRKSDQERSRRERLFEAADQEIERDLIQEMREEARQQRQAQQPAQPDHADPPASACQPRIAPRCGTRIKTESTGPRNALPNQSQGTAQ